MPRTVKTVVYQFDELSDRAKENARQWYREASSDDSYWSEHILEEAPRLLALCGFSIDKARHGRGDAIYWSGFWSQGDGACFEGSWAPSLLNVDALKLECPASWTDEHGVEHACESNAELWTIADESARLAALDPSNGIGWRCRTTRGNNVSFEHWDERESEHCERQDEENADCGGRNGDCLCSCKQCTLEPIDGLQDEHESNARDAMHWIYRQLEREWEYANSDEAVDENIRANEYEFDEGGNRA